MTRPDNSHFFARIGAVEFPVEGDQVTDEQLFSVCDPIVDRLLKLLRAAVNKELGQDVNTVEPSSVWSVARTGTRLATELPVADTLYTAPTPELLLSSEYGFPLLCVYRGGSESDGKWSLDIDRLSSNWGIEYILGPLDPADHRRLAGALTTAHGVLLLTLRRGSHPAYDEGRHQFPEPEIWSIQAMRSQIGPARFGEQDRGQIFYGVRVSLDIVELIDHDTTVYPAHEGTDLNVGVGGPEGVLADVMQARTPGNPQMMPPTMG
jgi:hypothetical protein